MMVESIDACAPRIPFRSTFRHASAHRAVTQTMWVVARTRDGRVGCGEGCPREYVSGESMATALAFVAARDPEWRASIHDLAALSAWVEGHRADIDRHPAAWAAVELALLDLIGQSAGCTLESSLGLPEISGIFRYTAVLGDATPRAFAAQLAAYREAGFCDFKIKLVGDLGRDRAKVQALRAAGIAPETVRADANNRWPTAEAAISHLRALDFAFWAVEEPLRVGDTAGMRRVRAALGTRIILDESMLRRDQLAEVSGDVDCWIANVRLSKMGGLLRSLQFAAEARQRGLPLIVGAHVGETSLLTRAALALVSAFRDGVVGQEGAFGTRLLERDMVEPSLMFGRHGILDATATAIGHAPGLGLSTLLPV
jgi:L-alanine-DL-glutamate epimerase-like enolase superfamily enzyme